MFSAFKETVCVTITEIILIIPTTCVFGWEKWSYDLWRIKHVFFAKTL